MNPFEMVVAIVAITAIASVIRAKYGVVRVGRGRNAREEIVGRDDPEKERLREELLELIGNLTIPAVIISHDPDDVDTFAGGLVLYDRGGARTVTDYADMRKDFATAGKCLRYLQEQNGAA